MSTELFVEHLLCVLQCAKDFTPTYHLTSCEAGPIVIPILQMRKVSQREIRLIRGRPRVSTPVCQHPEILINHYVGCLCKLSSEASGRMWWESMNVEMLRLTSQNITMQCVRNRFQSGCLGTKPRSAIFQLCLTLGKLFKSSEPEFPQL